MHPDSRPVRTALACLLLAASAAAPCTHAATVHRYERVRMEVVDRDSGDTLTAIRHDGEDWVPGEPGRPYAIRLTNTSSGRVLVVVSVDGINAVSGETADPSQTGYVLGPHQTTEITGWRKSFEDVARFEFSAASDSYAARSGRPDRCSGAHRSPRSSGRRSTSGVSLSVPAVHPADRCRPRTGASQHPHTRHNRQGPKVGDSDQGAPKEVGRPYARLGFPFSEPGPE